MEVDFSQPRSLFTAISEHREDKCTLSGYSMLKDDFHRHTVYKRLDISE